MKPDYAVMVGLKQCPRVELHSVDPPTSLSWLDRTRRKMDTHRPVKCPGCGLFKIWEPRPSEW